MAQQTTVHHSRKPQKPPGLSRGKPAAEMRMLTWPDNELMYAVEEGDNEKARMLLNFGAHIDAATFFGWKQQKRLGKERWKMTGMFTGERQQEWLDLELMRAAERGDSAKAWKLLNFGANIEAATFYGWTVLMAAVANERTQTCRLLLKAYEKAGGDMKKYLEAKASDCGYTALTLAGSSGHAEICALLLRAYEKAGGNAKKYVLAGGNDGSTVIQIALRHGGSEKMKTAAFLSFSAFAPLLLPDKESRDLFYSSLRECISS